MITFLATLALATTAGLVVVFVEAKREQAAQRRHLIRSGRQMWLEDNSKENDHG